MVPSVCCLNDITSPLKGWHWLSTQQGSHARLPLRTPAGRSGGRIWIQLLLFPLGAGRKLQASPPSHVCLACRILENFYLSAHHSKITRDFTRLHFWFPLSGHLFVLTWPWWAATFHGWHLWTDWNLTWSPSILIFIRSCLCGKPDTWEVELSPIAFPTNLPHWVWVCRAVALISRCGPLFTPVSVEV